MKHELEARTKQGMEEKIHELETILGAINSDFAKCARGTSACFFCANDQHCVDPDKNGCNFIWKTHN